MIANNVLAHVPDMIDFLKGIEICLKNTGCVTIEFPHVENLVLGNQFDTIYHEHYSYIGVISLQNAAIKCGMEIFRVEELETHGGSVRIYMAKKIAKVETSVGERIEKEEKAGLNKRGTPKFQR